MGFAVENHGDTEGNRPIVSDASVRSGHAGAGDSSATSKDGSPDPQLRNINLATPLGKMGGSDAQLQAASSQILADFHKTESQRHIQVSQELTYDKYLTEVLRRPQVMLRNPCEYTADAMESFGYTKKNILGRDILDFNLRQWPWESPRVRERTHLEGQELALYEFYEEMRLLGRKEYANRGFIFHGPPGAGKTLLNRTLNATLEHYSKHDPNGVLYRLIWVFPDKGIFRGFAEGIAGDAGSSVDVTETNHGLVYRPIMNTDPLFLLSKSYIGSGPRETLLEVIEREGRAPNGVNVDYIEGGVLDTFSEQILETLLDFYRADLQQRGEASEPEDVLKLVLENHVRTEQWTLSSAQGRGIISLQGSVDRNGDNVELYQSFSPPPPELLANERGLVMPTNFMALVNRGHLHTSDFFRKHGQDLSSFDNLLNEIELGETQIFSHNKAAAIKTEKANRVFRADANDEDIRIKAGAHGWDALGRRFKFISTPNPVRFLSEAAAHRDFFRTIVRPGHAVCPHVLETLCLYVTSTRLLKPNPIFYKQRNAELPEVIRKMSVVEKALLLQEPRDGYKRDVNMLKLDSAARWSQEQVNLLLTSIDEVAREHSQRFPETRFSLYDGGFGIAPAHTQDLLKELAKYRSTEPISVLEVLEVLKRRGKGYEVDIQAARVQRVQAMFDERVQELAQQGSPPDEKRRDELLKETNLKVAGLFPIPSADSLLAEVEVFARQRVLEDFYRALGIAGDEQNALSLRKYLAHALVSIGQGAQVPEKYRVTRTESGANIALLLDFEDRVAKGNDLSSVTAREQYRKGLFERIGDWQAEHPEERASENYDTIFEDLVKKIRDVQKESLEKPLKDLRQHATEYSADPARLERDITGTEEQRRKAHKFLRTMRILGENYPLEGDWGTIRKHLEWVVRGVSPLRPALFD